MIGSRGLENADLGGILPEAGLSSNRLLLLLNAGTHTPSMNWSSTHYYTRCSNMQ